MKTEIDKELLIRYINGRCTADDLSRVKQFLQNPEWQQALENLLEADYLSIEDKQPDEATLEEWNQEFRDKYFKKSAVKLWRTQWMGYAAACLLLLGIGGYFFSRLNTIGNGSEVTVVAMVKKTNPRGVRSKVILPDSSVVYLGAGSSITFPEQFAAQQRTMTLTGEAFFEITKNPKRPFVIHTGQMQTTVLGTSFKITAFTGTPLSVEVATGKVRVSREKSIKETNELAVLLPGEAVTWDGKSQNAISGHTDIFAIKKWVTGEISFKNRSLLQIAAELENWYNVDISFTKTAKAQKRLSLSVDGTAPLANALDIICNTAHLNYHFSGKQQVIISANK